MHSRRMMEEARASKPKGSLLGWAGVEDVAGGVMQVAEVAGVEEEVGVEEEEEGVSRNVAVITQGILPGDV